MQSNEKLRELIERLIDFNNISVQFKVEFRDKKNKKVYMVAESENHYRLERKIRNKSFRLSLRSFEELKDQKNLSKEDKEIFSKLFKRLNNGQIDKIAIRGLKLRNPILTSSIGQSIIAGIAKQISLKDRRELYNLWKERRREKFEEKFFDIIINIITLQLKGKLESEDLPTPVFPTSVALSEKPNYYIIKPKESYTLYTKMELFNKLANSICGRCGQRLYGLYIPEEGQEIREILKGYVPDFYNINIGSIAEIGRINLNEVGAFEYVFYLLDKVLQELFRRNKIPEYHIELLVIEGVGGGKKFFSHYIIPNLNEIFSKLYYGNNKYWVSASGKPSSKIKALISSFLVENWNIDASLKRNNSEIAHAYINRLLYFIFCHKRLDLDSILFLEDLKIKLGDTKPILFLEEVISWM
ncbi:MAG: hypothetical protein ABGF52_13635 [Candidatus Asgardarchaeum sp.]